uniref:Uncharacterized protein n=1 Tax=Chlamydomonas euryale TaxID=1486919 RepID=A0A7R9YU35_9CHLO
MAPFSVMPDRPPTAALPGANLSTLVARPWTVQQAAPPTPLAPAQRPSGTPPTSGLRQSNQVRNVRALRQKAPPVLPQPSAFVSQDVVTVSGVTAEVQDMWKG